jgi:hypothetical protein
MDSFGMDGLASDMLSPLSAVSATPEAAVPASMVRSGELGLLMFRQVSHTVTEEATDLVERIQRITVGHSSGSLVASDPEGPDPQLMINTPSRPRYSPMPICEEPLKDWVEGIRAAAHNARQKAACR